MAEKPRARTDELVVTEVENETIVYDLQKHRAHSLNPTAALVWQNCDGQRTITDLASLVKGDSSEDAVWQALADLEKADLLIDAPDSWMGPSTRRDFMKKAGMVGAAVGAASVVSLAVPLAAAAASCVPNAPGCVATNGSCTAGPGAGNVCCSCICDVDGGPTGKCS